MANVIKTVVGVALIVVGIVVPGMQWLIGPGIALTLSGLQGMLAKKPKTNTSSGARLNKSLDPEAFRKIVLGSTAGGADLRYWEVYGSGDKQYDEVIAVAGHQINSFQGFYIEEEAVTFSGGAVVAGTYAGLLTRATSDGHVGNAALAVGAGAHWTAASKFRGSAHYVLRWTYDQNKLPQGVPSRYTCAVEGALLYDPRKDSTRGGAGSHRADDQATWEYSPLDSNGKPIGRNNALQVLWYLIGWRIQDTSGAQQLVAGRGVELSDIDFPAFITAANDCEALGLYTDCLLSTGDTHQTNESILTADGAIGTLIDPGGLWTYCVNKDDTGVTDVDLTDDDVVDTGTVEWKPAHTMAEQYNRVVGSFVDPAAPSLYQSKPYPQAVSLTYEASDGFKKRKSVNYQAIQDGQLAQYLSTTILNESRWQGEFTAKFNFRALKTKLYGIVALTLRQYTFASKLFRVLSMSVEMDGVTMRLGEVDPSIWVTGAPGTVGTTGSGANGSTAGAIPLAGVSIAPISTTTNGATYPGLRVSWAATPPTVKWVMVRYRKSGDTTWTQAANSDNTHTSIDIYGLGADTTYDVQTQTLSTFGVLSGWSATANQTTGPSAEPPIYLAPITSANLSYKFTGSVSYTDTTTDITISVSAGNLLLGTTTVPYNAMSATITGLTPGSTHNWFLYVAADAYTPGSHTLLATENGDAIFNDNNNVFVGTTGSIVMPSSGTDGGGGFEGTGYCVCEEAWVTLRGGEARAGDVLPGDDVLVLSDDRERLDWQACESNERGLEHCYRIRGRESGFELTCSQSTPLTLRDGSTMAVSDLDGHELPLCSGSIMWWEPCDAEHVGLRVVRKIRANQKTYAAGDEPGRSIMTHNPFYDKP